MESRPAPHKEESAPMTASSSPVLVSRDVAPEGSDDVPDAKPSSAFASYLRVFSYCDTTSWVMNGVAFLCMIASGTLLPIMDLLFGKFVTVFNDFSTGQLSPEGFQNELNKYTLYYVYLFIAKFVLGYVWTVLAAITAIRTTKALRIDFLRQTLRQDLAFLESRESPSVASQITTNGNLVNQGISEKLGITVQACASFITAFIVAFAVQWKLTLIIVGIVPLNLLITMGTVVISTAYEFKMMQSYTIASALAEEAFSSMRTIHAFWAYPKLSQKFERILDDAKSVGAKKSPVYAIMFSFEFFAIYGAYGLAFWQGFELYARGEIKDPGTIVTVIFAIVVAAQALTQIAPQAIQMSKAAAAAQELFATIDRKSRIDSLSEDGNKPSECDGSISFHGVQFAYPTRKGLPVLKDFDLEIPARKTTALVGTSGSGKSTVVGLIERWYSPDKGEITLDGRNINDLNIRWLRSSIRLVQQEPTLFNGTIYENVAHGLAGTGLGGTTEDEKRAMVTKACNSAFAHEFIELLPEGYDTQIGERGATLSGGQKQRIVIARSIISDPKVLLLDEATSALDPKAENIVQEALNNVAIGRTMVVIAHRLSTIRSADNIVVMSRGAIAEQGTHEELIAANGTYAQLVRAQDLGEGVGSPEGSSSDRGYTSAPKIETVASKQAVEQAHAVEEPKVILPKYGLVKCLAIIASEQRPLWVPMIIIAVSCIAGGVTYPALAILFAKVMTAFELQESEMLERGAFFSLMFFMVAIGNLIAYAVLGWFCNVVAQAVMKSYMLEIFDNTLRQDMSFFDDPQNTTGALVSRLSSEPTNLQELLSANVGLILINIVNLVSSCILAIIVGWKLGLVLVLGALPPLVFSGYLRIRLEFQLDNDTAGRFAFSGGIASEAILAIRTVSSLALENDVLRRYRNSLQHIAEKSFRSLGWRMFWFSLSQAVSFLAMALGFWYGGRLMSYGEYSSSQFYVVFIATVFSGESAAAFFQYGTSITKARTSSNYIFQLRKQAAISSGEHWRNDEKPAPSSHGGSAVSCQELEFAYPRRPHLKVLKAISAKVETGRFVAFVGHSGCGKSTMISLLERLYDPTAGRIVFDGQDAKSMDLRTYRQNIAFVQQEPVLYSGSIRENISLGTGGEDPSDEEIMSACEQANIWEFISSLPDGLATSCGSQGLQISGGQRQRISIARALIRRPRLLLLDEATSALDTESESAVKEALDKASEGRTTIAVAHRLSTIMDADVIFVFSSGQIVEHGTHKALLGKKGVYYEMCLGQSLDKAT